MISIIAFNYLFVVDLYEVKIVVMKKLLILLFTASTLVSCERKYIEPFPKATVVTKISYSQEIEPLFTPDCTICHYNGGTFPDLTIGASYGELLTGTPVICTSYNSCLDTLNPTLSLLYVKLLPSPTCGARMPSMASPWSSAKIQLVLDWIDQGAHNN